MNSTLFTEITTSEEAIVSGGGGVTKVKNERSNGTVTGASGGAATGGTVGSSTANASSAEGVYISN